ncbi:hypothetical protein N9017_01520 [Akkermansiaceae bacterium]|nr:hypothetical protein [Akkermansiaceae bacterium]
MDAKDIAVLFRSAVEAEDGDLLRNTETFAEQDFFTQLGWFTNQIEARLNMKKNTPSPDVLALMVAAGGSILKIDTNAAINKAYEIWQAGDVKIRAATLCSRKDIEENLSQVGVEFRLGVWNKKKDGSDRINLEFVPFMRLCIPDQTEDELKTLYRYYIEDTHLGEKKLSREDIQSRLREKTGSRFLPEALNAEGRQIVGWWMKHESFDPLSFPNGSLGQLTQIALGMMPEKSQKKRAGKT